MRFTSEQRLDEVVLEREFTLNEIPGIPWTPGSAPAPLTLVGHPGGLRRMYPRLAGRARHCPANGSAAATIELPGGGDRPRSADAEQARADLHRALAAGEAVDEIVDRLVVPLVDKDVAGRPSGCRGLAAGRSSARPGWAPPGRRQGPRSTLGETRLGTSFDHRDDAGW